MGDIRIRNRADRCFSNSRNAVIFSSARTLLRGYREIKLTANFCNRRFQLNAVRISSARIMKNFP